MLLTSSLFLYAAAAFLAAFLFLYLHHSRLKTHWKDRGVPFLDPLPILGNTADWILGRIHSAAWIKNIYDSSDGPYLGIFIFWMPRLLLLSPDLIKRVMVSDFDAFPNRNVAKSHDEITNNMTFMQQTPSWKPMRNKLSPIFSSARLKGMFPILNDVGDQMVEYISKNLGVLEAKSVAGKYATETICFAFFGVDAFAFEEKSFLHDLVKQMNSGSFSSLLRQISYAFLHPLVGLFRLSFFPGKLQDPLTKTLMEVLKERQKSSRSKGDFVDFLIEIKEDEEFCKTHNFVGRATAGPAIQFLFAGHETTASTIAFTLYELAIHSELQDKARKDILDAIQRCEGLSYDAIQEMRYLKMCVQETLRKYPVLSMIDRKCSRDYNIPGTDLVVRKDETVVIPVMGLHYDEKYFPQPEKYMPERFEKKMNVNGLYYLPFGEGPRACIGERFGLMNAQTCLSYILKNFSVSVCSETPIPLKFDKKTVTFISETGLSLKFESL